MSTVLEQISDRPHVAHVDDERNLDNGIVVTLREGFYFASDPGCGVRGFDSPKEAERGTRTAQVYKT